MHAVEVAAGHGQVAGLLSTAGQYHRIKILLQLLWCDGFLRPVSDFAVFGQVANHHAAFENHALSRHLINAAVNVDFFHLEVGNAVAQQAADAVVLFKQRDIVACPRQLLRCRHARRAAANDGNFFAGFVFWQLRRDPALSPGSVDDGMFDGFNADSVVIHVEHAGSFARCGANAAGEFRKVIGAVQRVNCVFPVGTKYHVVEIRNDVVDRAARAAKRRAAIHASSRLVFGLFVVQTDDEFFVIFQALGHGLVALFQALKFHETGDFSHDAVL